jgi:chemotaxis protein MotC
MKVNGLPRAVIAAVLMVMPGTVTAESGSPQAAEPMPQQTQRGAANPVQMVRTLQLMQDQIAAGSTEAHMGQRGLLEILDRKFMELQPEVWQDSRNVRAAIAFVLSGGNPQILRRLLELGSSVVPEGERPLIEGTLAYVEGREEAAKGALLSIDPKTMPPMLGAQLALVQSALVVRTDAKKSVELLDFVRLQAPGTLLEEAALRRQVFVTSQIDDAKKFQALATTYLRRYRSSIYAGNFRQRLASALTQMDFGKDPSRFEGTVQMMMELEPTARRDLYLLASKSSIDQGQTRSAQMLAEKARELSGNDAVSAARAKLYRAAAMIVAPGTIAAAVDDLLGIDRSILDHGDAALLDSALTMAGQIRQLPGDATASDARAKPPAGSGGGQSAQVSDAGQAPEQLQAVTKAREALNRIDKLIKSQASTIQ